MDATVVLNDRGEEQDPALWCLGEMVGDDRGEVVSLQPDSI